MFSAGLSDCQSFCLGVAAIMLSACVDRQTERQADKDVYTHTHVRVNVSPLYTFQECSSCLISI